MGVRVENYVGQNRWFGPFKNVLFLSNDAPRQSWELVKADSGFVAVGWVKKRAVTIAACPGDSHC